MRSAVLAACLVVGLSGAAAAESASLALPAAHGGIGAGPLVVGIAGHHFADQGLDLAIEEVADDAAVAQAVAEGRAQFGAVRLDGGFFAYAAAHALTIVAPEYSDQTGFPATGLLISKAASDAGLRGPRSLAHRRVGLLAPESARFELAEVARRFQLAPDAIELVPLGSEEEALLALDEGRVDAVALPYAVARAARGEGRGVAVLRLSDFQQSQQGVVVARGDTSRVHPGALAAFMRGYLEALADYNLTFQQRDDEGRVLPGPRFQPYLAAMAAQAHLAPSLLAYALPYCDHLGRVDRDDLARQLSFWQGAGAVPAGVTLESLLDLSHSPAPIAR